MRNGCFVSLLTTLYLLQQITVNGQSTYNEIPKQEIAECVLDFVNNRDCFKNYGCLMSFELQDLGIKATTTKNWDACIFEDLENRQLRSEISRTYQSISDDGTETASKIPIWSMFSIKGRKTIFEGGKEIKSFDGMAEFVVVPDPWMAAISEVNLINAGRSSGSNYWLQILDEGGLLWGEENDEFKRGEWIFGVGEGRTYVQVYFAKNKNNLPALVRYILPRDWNARFSKKGSVVSENEIVWERFGDGYVPVEINFQRENFWATKPGIKSSEFGTMKFVWESELANVDGAVDPRVFAPRNLSFEDLKRSFAAPKSTSRATERK